MVDCQPDASHADDLLLEKAKRFRGKTILALKQGDRLAKPKLLPLIDSLQGLRVCGDRAISALNGAGCEELLDETLKQLPQGAILPEDQVTDSPNDFWRQSHSRESHTGDVPRVPYALAVVIEKYEETPKLLRIEALMNWRRFSEKDTHRPQGRDAQKNRNGSRKELEAILGSKIYLGLFVKVAPDGGKSPEGARARLAYQLEGLAGELEDKE